MAQRDGTLAYRAAVLHVRRQLNDLDPDALDPGKLGGAPADDYELQAGPLVALLLRNGQVTEDEVDSIWSTWFNETLTAVVGRRRVVELVVRLNLFAR